MWAYKTETVATVPDDLQVIVSILHVISIGGDAVAACNVNRSDVGWGVGGIGVRILVEGVVSGRGAVWMSRCLHFDSARGEDHCVADDCLGIRATGSRAARLVGQVTL